MSEIVARGAEAVLRREDLHLIKERIKKSYRIQKLDVGIRRDRTRREVRLMEKASVIIPVPKILSHSESSATINMEFIEGKKLSEHLDLFTDEKRIAVCNLIGKQVALLHNANIIHGDLTTSNMILHPSGKLYFIDFGLGFIDQKVEHKAVDLHLLKQALESKHYRHYETSFSSVLDSYKKHCKNAKEVLLRLEKVEGRGRYKGKKDRSKRNYI